MSPGMLLGAAMSSIFEKRESERAAKQLRRTG